MPSLSFTARNLCLEGGGVLSDYDGAQLRLYTGPDPGPDAAPTGTLLVTLTLGTPAFVSPPVAGVATAHAIASGVAINGGDIGYGRTVGATSVADWTVGTAPDPGVELVFPTLAVGVGETVSCSALTWSQPQ